MGFSSSLGLLAAFLTTAAFVPQVFRVVRTRDTHAISLTMYLMFAAGVALWLIYGILLGLWPVIIANGITLLLALMVIALKLRRG
ncbi:SemiSWEET transporter [Thiosocius teredinicola]|uniref:SemiSWEET transporter n=1 Tax=Thiosocius teredinicola TaxID=1973002 RepID=UPI000990EDD8